VVVALVAAVTGVVVAVAVLIPQLPFIYFPVRQLLLWRREERELITKPRYREAVADSGRWCLSVVAQGKAPTRTL
jgi:hypothetical protein